MLMFQNLLGTVQPVRLVNATVAGTSTITTSGIDCSGAAGITFVLALGAITSTGVPSLKAQHSDDDGSSDAYADLAGSLQTAADTAGNQMIVIDISRPLKKYIRFVIGRATANVVLDAGVALLYNFTNAPPAIDTTQFGTTKKILNQPAAGTA